MLPENPLPEPGPTPWTYSGSVADLGAGSGGLTTLIEGQTFCLSERNGDIRRGQPHGLFMFDTRVLSVWRMTVNGMPIEPLAVDLDTPFHARFAGRAVPPLDQADSNIVVFRDRSVSAGMHERLTVRNVGLDSASVRVELTCAVDFANLFEVKERRDHRQDAALVSHSPTVLTFAQRTAATTLRMTVKFSEPADVATGTWERELEAGSEWQLRLDVSAATDGDPPRDHERHGLPTERLRRWRHDAPTIRSDLPGFDAAVARGIDDLGSLRMFDPEHTGRAVVAAGAPWFMALFGRDSLLTAWMALPVAPDLAVGVAQTLAALQGTRIDPVSEEQPGRILHESRFGPASEMSARGGATYYGTADATPLFVMLVGELHRWGADPQIIDALLPAVDAALGWIDRFGDLDGDGYVEYQRISPDGLANQGWKDSWDAIRFADGRLANTPIALCEVQAYVYGAFRARADLARGRDDPIGAKHWDTRADDLAHRFHRDFWMPDLEWYALGLDRDKEQIDGVASNVGHCLWTGIVAHERAAAIADRLVQSDLFSGWGLRTLSQRMPAYNPVSYHNGSVWPHDTALCAAGLTRYGFTSHAHRLILGLVDAASHHSGRLPELFAGFSRDELGVPAAYPTSCSPQAWAAAAPLLALRSLLRLDPAVPDGHVWISPELPDTMRTLQVHGIAIGTHRVDVRIADHRVEVAGAEGCTIIPHPRPEPNAVPPVDRAGLPAGGA